MMKLKKGFAVAMAAGVLTTGGLGVQASVFSATAFAVESGPVTDQNATVAGTATGPATLPVATKTGSLTIHKHDGLMEDESGATVKATDAGSGQNGLLQENKKFGHPVPGAEFTIKKIKDFDLSKNAGWQKLAKAVKDHEKDAPAVIKGKTLGDPIKTSTDEHGVATFRDLPLGAYYVEETKVPDDYVARTRPFIVTVPMTNPTDHNAWVYDLNVYAKNDPKQDQKTVHDSGAQIFGNKAEYTIATQLKTGAEGTIDPYDQFVITDFFPQDRLEFAKADGTPVTDLTKIVEEDLVVSYGAEKTPGDSPAENTYSAGTKLEKDTDWEFVTKDAGDPPTTPASGSDLAAGRVVIKLTETGLGKLNAADNNDKYLTVKLKLQVKENADDQTAPIINKFDVTNNRKGNPPKTPPTTPPATPPGKTPPQSPPSYYGNVDIVKKNDKTRIPGAEFDVYTCTPNYNGEHKITGYTLTKGTDKKLNKTAIVADDTETPDIKGLLANDWRDGKSTVTAEGEIPTAYCLVETKAPDGLELLAQPIGFQVLKDKSAETIPLTSTGAIINTKKNGGFELPLTGGKGVFALLLAGAAFLVLGRGYSVYAGRRKDA